MNILLRLKHWQLFVIVFGIPFILNLVLTVSTFSSGYSSFMFALVATVISLSIACIFGWYYSLGINLHKKLPETIKVNVRRFNICLLATVFYSIFFFYFWIKTKKEIMLGQPMNTSMFYLMPFHILSIACLLYCLYFIAKILKAVELQRPVLYNDFASDFFLLLFYPVGIWIIQPRVNKLFND